MDNPQRCTLRDGVPFSETYQDVYYSRANGLAESRHVFLRGNHLPERWCGQERFVIAETGFGTGRNFLTTVQEFQSDPNAPRELWYLSVEKHPLTKTELAETLALWGAELGAVADALLFVYPERPAGTVLMIPVPGVRLCLISADVEVGLQEMAHTIQTQGIVGVDAWYWDGFAPAVNPEMWSLAVMTQAGQLCKAGATGATYTVAGSVRHHLRAAGFSVEKVAGFGLKREMITAIWWGM